jgi:hypothetical protein
MEDIPVPPPAKPERFMDRLRAFMGTRHLAYRTEKTFWTKQVGGLAFSPNSLSPQKILWA